MLQAIHAQDLPGEKFCSWQFNLYVFIFTASIFSRSQERRHAVFKWLITILASVFVVFGTVERIIQISGWSPNPSPCPSADNALSQHEVDRYFKLSLASWIACIIVDGYTVLNIFLGYKGNRIQLVKNFITKWTVPLLIEKGGLFVSLLYMIKLGFDVYNNFNHLTSDTWLYFYFAFCAVCKISRAFIQGLVITVDTPTLVTRPNLTSHLLVSSFFLMVQVVVLTRFNPDQLWSLMAGDAAYRTFQFAKIKYYCCYADRKNVLVQESTLNKDITTSIQSSTFNTTGFIQDCTLSNDITASTQTGTNITRCIYDHTWLIHEQTLHNDIVNPLQESTFYTLIQESAITTTIKESITTWTITITTPIQESTLHNNIANLCFIPSIQDGQHGILCRPPFNLSLIRYLAEEVMQDSLAQHSLTQQQESQQPRTELPHIRREHFCLLLVTPQLCSEITLILHTDMRTTLLFRGCSAFGSPHRHEDFTDMSQYEFGL